MLDLRTHFFNHSFIFVVSADPNPDEVFTILDRKRPLIHSDSRRPELANFFKMEGGMRRVRLKQLEVLFRYLSNRFWKVREAFPEAVSGTMHLDSLEFSLRFFIMSFLDQGIQLS